MNMQPRQYLRSFGMLALGLILGLLWNCGAPPFLFRSAESTGKSSRALETSDCEMNDELTIFWQKECGCTGMHEEAVTILHSLQLYPPQGLKLNLRSNRCKERCGRADEVEGFMDKIEKEGDISDNDNDIVVVHEAFRGVCGVHSDAAKSAYRVTRSMYETDSLPSSAVSNCNSKFYKEIWVPTDFNIKSFSQAGVNPSKMLKVPEAIDTRVYDPELYRLSDVRDKFYAQFLKKDKVDLKNDQRVKFYSVFKWEARKNWRGLLQAFSEEFQSEKDNVVLYIKTYKAWEGAPSQDTYTYRQNKKNPEVVLLERRMSTKELAFLYTSMDSFVLPTHGEGWGLPTMEAMAMELGVITTNWGGSTEFANNGNAYMVSVDKMEPAFRGQTSEKWAVPSVTDLRAKMRTVYADVEGRREKGKQARQDVINNYSKKAIASQLGERLVALKNKLKQ